MDEESGLDQTKDEEEKIEGAGDMSGGGDGGMGGADAGDNDEEAPGADDDAEIA